MSAQNGKRAGGAEARFTVVRLLRTAAHASMVVPFHRMRPVPHLAQRTLMILLAAGLGLCVVAVEAAPPERPRATVDTSDVRPIGRTIAVLAGGNVQAALNAAQPGDVITLEAGATFRGPFTLPNKAGLGWITVRTSAPDSSLPPPGTE